MFHRQLFDGINSWNRCHCTPLLLFISKTTTCAHGANMVHNTFSHFLHMDNFIIITFILLWNNIENRSYAGCWELPSVQGERAGDATSSRIRQSAELADLWTDHPEA